MDGLMAQMDKVSSKAAKGDKEAEATRSKVAKEIDQMAKDDPGSSKADS